MQFVDLRALYDEIRDEIDDAIRASVRQHRVHRRHRGADGSRRPSPHSPAPDTRSASPTAPTRSSSSLAACELPPGAGVIVPANTFIATAEAVVAAGLRPVFVDVDRDTGLLDLEAAEAVAADCSGGHPRPPLRSAGRHGSRAGSSQPPRPAGASRMPRRLTPPGVMDVTPARGAMPAASRSTRARTSARSVTRGR